MISIKTQLLPISLRRSGQKLLGVYFLVAHDTANPGSTAQSNVDYYIKSANEMEASSHYFVDDVNIIQCVPSEEKAWHVRYISPKDNEIYGRDANDWALGIELCYGGVIDDEKAYKNYVELFSNLCKQYNLNPEQRIAGHYMLDPIRRNDPLVAFKKINKTWADFIGDVKNSISGSVVAVDNISAADVIKCQEELKQEKTLLQKMWVFILDLLAKKQ